MQFLSSGGKELDPSLWSRTHEFDIVSRAGPSVNRETARFHVVSMCPTGSLIGLLCFLFVSSELLRTSIAHRSEVRTAERFVTSPGSDFILTANRMEPLFDPTTARNLTIASGKTAYLPCRVRHLGERTISWIRKSDLHVLTVGKFSFTSDERFRALHLDNTEDWGLQIRFTSHKDADEYICQVSGQEKQNLIVRLNVVLSSAKIVEGPVVYMNSGFPLRLTCLVKQSPAPPDFIFWHHNGEVLSYDSHRGIRVETDSSAQPTSKLIIEKAHPTDSGNYSCVCDSAEAAHVAVHVLPSGGHPAAIQHGKRSAGDFVRNLSSHATLPLSSIVTFLSVLLLSTIACPLWHKH